MKSVKHNISHQGRGLVVLQVGGHVETPVSIQVRDGVRGQTATQVKAQVWDQVMENTR